MIASSSSRSLNFLQQNIFHHARPRYETAQHIWNTLNNLKKVSLKLEIAIALGDFLRRGGTRTEKYVRQL